MPSIRIPFNYGFHVKNSTRHGTVEVYLRDGNTRNIHWLGFIDLDDAIALGLKQKATPVKIRAVGISHEEKALFYTKIPKDKFIQGCLIDQGVFAVTTTSVRVIG